jgi:hypothetical protein
MFNLRPRNPSYTWRGVFFLVRVLVKVRSRTSWPRIQNSRRYPVRYIVLSLYWKFQPSRCRNDEKKSNRRTDGRTDGQTHILHNRAHFSKMCSYKNFRSLNFYPDGYFHQIWNILKVFWFHPKNFDFFFCQPPSLPPWTEICATPTAWTIRPRGKVFKV